MLTLALDTGGEDTSLALADGEALLAVLQARTRAQAQGEFLFPALDALFRLADRRAAGVARIAVATGPGSYTGLRNGLAVAKTLAQLTGAPVLPVDSLTLLAARAELPGLLCPWLDIRRGEVYTALVEKRPATGGAALAALEPPGARPAEAWIDRLAALAGPVYVLGDGAARWEALLAVRCPGARLVPEHRLPPAAAVLAVLAAGRESGWCSYREVVPVYPDRPVANERAPGPGAAGEGTIDARR